jgi:hypothetical protein
MPNRFLNRESELAQEAIDACRDDLEKFIKDHDKLGVHIVILDPSVKYHPGVTSGEELSNAGVIMWQESIFHDAWVGIKDYDIFARAKAYLSWREGMNSGDVPKFMLRKGDVRYAGSAYYKGLIVSISGLDSMDDQDKSFDVAKEIEKLVNAEFERWKGNNEGVAFV